MTPKISSLFDRMIDYYAGSPEDINHTLLVFVYASLIAQKEGLCEQETEMVQAAAIVHDLSCPLCRKKYGHAAGALQEKESRGLISDFLKTEAFDAAQTARLEYLVCHHHTPSAADAIDFQILIEADYLVNAAQSSYLPAAIQRFGEEYFQTETGKTLLQTLFLSKDA